MRHQRSDATRDTWGREAPRFLGNMQSRESVSGNFVPDSSSDGVWFEAVFLRDEV